MGHVPVAHTESLPRHVALVSPQLGVSAFTTPLKVENWRRAFRAPQSGHVRAVAALIASSRSKLWPQPPHSYS
jgi:hypothetical protein